MIKVNYIGRLGNNMIQYSLARFLAESKNYKLDTNLTTTGETGVNFMFNLFPSTTISINGDENTSNILKIGYDSKHNYIQHYNLDELLKWDGGIHLNGFFQKHNFMFSYRHIIRDYFKYDSSHLSSSNHDIVIHIRLGDYINLGWFIDPNKIYHMYKNLGFDNCLVITDDIENPYLNLFRNDPKCDIKCGSILQDLHYMITSKNLIISQSTFSWWGAFLGSGINQIFVPYDSSKKTAWLITPNIDDVDLIPNIKNYNKILCS